MNWIKRNESYYELYSRGNIEAMIKRGPVGWNCFLDATDMVSVVCIGIFQDLTEAKTITSKALSSHRVESKQSRQSSSLVSPGTSNS